jgi:hypothetical protein
VRTILQLRQDGLHADAAVYGMLMEAQASVDNHRAVIESERLMAQVRLHARFVSIITNLCYTPTLTLVYRAVIESERLMAQLRQHFFFFFFFFMFCTSAFNHSLPLLPNTPNPSHLYSFVSLT